MRKTLLIFLLLAIFYASNTPGLKATKPETWISLPSLKENVNLSTIFQPGSRFYKPVPFEPAKEFIARKSAHITFFGLLTLLFFWNLPKRRGRYALAVLLTGLFAFTDEIHQAFILDRDGRLTDVLLDTTSGAIVMLIVYWINRKRRLEENQHYA
ncbi:VanZ family protein [Bacillus songklensis]